MTIETPEFQGTHLWDRLCWAKEKLEPYRTEYCVVWEDPETPDEPAKVTHPDPNWMACALQGGILPPVEVYWELAKDEAKPDFVKHTRGYLLHNTKPIDLDWLSVKRISFQVQEFGEMLGRLMMK